MKYVREQEAISPCQDGVGPEAKYSRRGQGVS